MRRKFSVINRVGWELECNPDKFKKKTSTLLYRKNQNHIYGDEFAKIVRGCNRYLIWIKKNPPNLKGHLKGGVDTERMLKIKAEIENRGK